MKNFANEIHEYWGIRASGYSEYNCREMADERKNLWKQKILFLIRKYFPEKSPSQIKILDVGTGPGFLAVLLAEEGYEVTAVDCTEEMLCEAKKNAGALAEKIIWKLGDAQNLDFSNDQFDIVVTRNVTWNLENPQRAYGEWCRVLKKDGRLFNFDADWYGHLFNPEKRNSYELDRENVKKYQVEDYYADTDVDKMEELARRMPLSREERPQWDIQAMENAGFQEVKCEKDVWKEVWNEEELLNNGASLLFLLNGRK